MSTEQNDCEALAHCSNAMLAINNHDREKALRLLRKAIHQLGGSLKEQPPENVRWQLLEYELQIADLQRQVNCLKPPE